LRCDNSNEVFFTKEAKRCLIMVTVYIFFDRSLYVSCARGSQGCTVIWSQVYVHINEYARPLVSFFLSTEATGVGRILRHATFYCFDGGSCVSAEFSSSSVIREMMFWNSWWISKAMLNASKMTLLHGGRGGLVMDQFMSWDVSRKGCRQKSGDVNGCQWLLESAWFFMVFFLRLLFKTYSVYDKIRQHAAPNEQTKNQAVFWVCMFCVFACSSLIFMRCAVDKPRDCFGTGRFGFFLLHARNQSLYPGPGRQWLLMRW